MGTDHLARFKWQPGRPSPNPKGRPRIRPMTTGYIKWLAKPVPDHLRFAQTGTGRTEIFPAGTTWLDMIMQALMMKAAAGDVRAIKELREAIEGRSALRLEIFNSDVDEESEEDPLAQSLMELDPADRTLIIAATRKVIDLTMEEVESGAEVEELASESNGSEGTEETGTADSGVENESGSAEGMGETPST